MIERFTIENNVREWVINNISKDFEFRDHQFEMICDIIDNIMNGMQPTHIVEAPTGSGKSLILMISAGVLADCFKKTSYILCSDLFLWKQYDDFIKATPEINKKFGCLKGQTGNYICIRNHEDIRNASCRIERIPWAKLFNGHQKYECCTTCKYVQERKKAQNAKVTLMTYQLYFFMINVVNEQQSSQPFPQRDIIFLDECHNIPSLVSNQYSPQLTLDLADKFAKLYDYNQSMFEGLFADQVEYKDLSEYWPGRDEVKADYRARFYEMTAKSTAEESFNMYIDFCVNFINRFNETVQTMEDNLAAMQRDMKTTISKSATELYKLTSWFRNLCCFMNDFKTAIVDCGPQYVIKTVDIKNDSNDKVVSFKCAKEDFMVFKYLMSTSMNQVMTSATVGLKASFCDNIGMKYMDEKEPKFDKMPSSFDFTKSPIIYYPKYSMGWKYKDSSFPKLKEMTYQIIRQFKDFKGIIQTGTYENAKSIYNDAPKDIRDRLILYNNSTEKAVGIDWHRSRKDSVIIGPTLNEGVDLPGDLCRFIIILKVPYPNLKDDLVKAKMELFPLWYTSEASNQIIQGIGRGNRFKEDWCVTYILDSCFGQLYNQTKEQFAPELVNRIKILK